ncbi:hypothetical protein Rsub_03746 [Raphidocelis subcapitata]|uniref:Uncharacterized protein n=1 Tax=Raphidocelis subcapitata TaxID=307507 RepID=A0A2V0NTC4_9CHLO|nr:hypothetical protein Rsub_03746 [Raphidocelis subcapitata]|eukprot:GBF90891.1 hypothetical protein Rsub_03746 [Raphidocelis subcapitata]
MPPAMLWAGSAADGACSSGIMANNSMNSSCSRSSRGSCCRCCRVDRSSSSSDSSSAPRRAARLTCFVAFAAALAALAAPAAADVAVLSEGVLPKLPIWATNRSADIPLDFSKADPEAAYPGLGSITYRGKTMQVKYHIGYFHGNVAMVRFGDRLVAAVRKMYFYKTLRTDIEGYPLSDKPNEGEISWWGSKLGVCSVDSATLQPIKCEHYDPRSWKECLWNKGFEGTGPEDPRLIVWPGKGLYVMFGSKPAPVNPDGVQPADTRCEGPWAFQPYLAQLLPYGAPDASDPWQQGLVRLRYMDGEPEEGELLKEKNWNPFVYKGKLFFSQQFDPHVVIEPHPNGTCTKVFETSSRAFQQLPTKPRGNTQAVLVPAGFSGEPRDFYLGVVHAEINRSYQNFFYKMQAHPPFRIFAMSSAMPIINAQHPRNLAWTSVSFPMSLDLIPETNQVMVGYGSGDKQARVRMMPWQEVQALFPPLAREGYLATWRYRE